MRVLTQYILDNLYLFLGLNLFDLYVYMFIYIYTYKYYLSLSAISKVWKSVFFFNKTYSSLY